MCGIWACLGASLDPATVQRLVQTLKARGPEGARVVDGPDFQLGFTRLAINGLTDDGMQPMESKGLRWMCNGELYNWSDLAERFNLAHTSDSDCSILGELFQTLGTQTDAPTVFRALDGVFALTIVDTKAGLAYIARDPYGVRPLFVGYEFGKPDEFGSDRASVVDGSGQRLPIRRIVFASELKALPLSSCQHVEAFPPGHYACYDLKTLNRIGFEAYHTIPWLKHPSLDTLEGATVALRTALESAVQKRMLTERPVAALLSGGLDSSLIAALVQRELLRAGSLPLKTFSIGFKGSEDLRYARMVADFIKSDHTEVVMTPDEFWDAIPDVIRSIESFDITTVRASVGNWLVSKYIAEHTDCKVVFNGDGSDEVFGGYKYFNRAPSDEAFEAETSRLLQDIHHFDVLRSDRSISSHGLEARTPFLDKQFVAVAKSISTDLRRPSEKHMEKTVLRIAMGDELLIPYDVLWRRKEAFSDGVSTQGDKSWYEICKEKALEEMGADWEQKAKLFTHLQPKTAEACYYRVLFDRWYHGADRCAVPYHWMPKWSPETTDPSARTLSS